MKELLIITFYLLITSLYFAQNEDAIKVQSDSTIYHEVDSGAYYSGGMNNLLQYILKNIKFPEEAKDYPIQSRFYIQFVVEKDGSISNIEPVHGKNHPTKLDLLFIKENEAIFYNMPKWNPAILKGEKVRSIYTIPLYIHWK